MLAKTAIALASGALVCAATSLIVVLEFAGAKGSTVPLAATAGTAGSAGAAGSGSNRGVLPAIEGNADKPTVGTAQVGSTPTGKGLDVTAVVTGKVALGVPTVLTVTINNLNNQTVILRSVSGTITRVTGGTNKALPPCNTAWFSIGAFSSTSRTLARNGSTTVQLPVLLSNRAATNQDNCKKASFAFSITATAAQAGPAR